MEEKKVTKISLSTFLLILTIIAIIVMGIFIYKLNNDKTIEIQKSTELQAKVNSLNRIVSELQEKNDVTYTVSVRDEVYATIKATKNGKTISKDQCHGHLSGLWDEP